MDLRAKKRKVRPGPRSRVMPMRKRMLPMARRARSRKRRRPSMRKTKPGVGVRSTAVEGRDGISLTAGAECYADFWETLLVVVG